MEEINKIQAQIIEKQEDLIATLKQYIKDLEDKS